MSVCPFPQHERRVEINSNVRPTGYFENLANTTADAAESRDDDGLRCRGLLAGLFLINRHRRQALRQLTDNRGHQHAEYDDQEQLLEQTGVDEIQLMRIRKKNQAEFAALREQ